MAKKNRYVEVEPEQVGKTWQEKRDESTAERFEKPVTPKIKLKAATKNHQRYIDLIKTSKVVFCTGMAGTSKTWTSCGMAAEMLLAGEITKIILTRPLVECDEQLGILPGDMMEKVSIYMAPVLETIKEFLGAKELEKYLADETIQVIPLAVMRGRTFKDAFIILDEAQNATYRQLKMFLTRFGKGSIVVVNGDTKQTDLYDNNSLQEVIHKLKRIDKPEISFVKMEREDVMRHPLIQAIDEALD